MFRHELDDLRVSRREFLGATAVAVGALLLPRSARSYALPDATRSALGKSPLIYVSPLRGDGSESKCHGEVWFVPDGSDVLVVTSMDRWKARAIAKGLDRARLWVGDFGVWTKSDGKFKSGPSFLATAVFDIDPAAIERALTAFGGKYPDEWGRFGPRFRNGLADGSRVLIRYQPSAA